MTLVEFLLARIDELAELAHRCGDQNGRAQADRYSGAVVDARTGGYVCTVDTETVAAIIARHSPADVLQSCESSRRIVQVVAAALYTKRDDAHRVSEAGTAEVANAETVIAEMNTAETNTVTTCPPPRQTSPSGC
jgi:hypothetical protein